MKKNKLFILILCISMLICAVSLIGCSNEAKVADVEKAQDYTVQLFYANAEYVTTGDESLERLMPAYESKIPASSSNVYVDTLEALKSVPEGGYETIITKEIKFNDIYVKDKTAYVDLNSKGLNGGSLSESFLISQIVETLINSFDEVVQVQFLVDGKVVESLMGHFDATKPFTSGISAE